MGVGLVQDPSAPPGSAQDDKVRGRAFAKSELFEGSNHKLGMIPLLSKTECEAHATHLRIPLRTSPLPCAYAIEALEEEGAILRRWLM